MTSSSLFFPPVLKTEPSALHMLGKHSSTELHPQVPPYSLLQTQLCSVIEFQINWCNSWVRENNCLYALSSLQILQSIPAILLFLQTVFSSCLSIHSLLQIKALNVSQDLAGWSWTMPLGTVTSKGVNSVHYHIIPSITKKKNSEHTTKTSAS
jgi:hypothetical protein